MQCPRLRADLRAYVAGAARRRLNLLDLLSATRLTAAGLTPRRRWSGGAFAEPGFPSPTVSLWEDRRHHWVELPAEIEHVP